MKMNNKKGIFFTAIVILIITILFMSYTLYDVVKNRKSIDKRIETLNSFVFSIEKDIPRYLYISGFRSIFIMQEEIVSQNDYITDVNSSFQELFYSSELNGEVKNLMIGATFNDMQDSFTNFADKINANISFNSPSITMDQQDPWNIHINFTANMIIEDKGNLVKWNRNISYESFIPIDGFEDPLYLVETGIITNKIVKTPFIYFVSGNDVSNLTSHLEESYYTSSTSAPSFLDRMEGKNIPSENGIESFVYLPKLTAQQFPIKDKSLIDYIYFSDNDPASYHVTNMPSWFRIDNESNHLENYNVTSLIY